MRIPNYENFQSYIIDSFEGLICFSVSGQPRVYVYTHTWKNLPKASYRGKLHKHLQKNLHLRHLFIKGFTDQHRRCQKWEASPLERRK